MRMIELRGFLAFALVVGAIALAWTTIENWQSTDAVAVVTTTSSTTTTTEAPTTTTPRQAIQAICQRSAQFAAVSSALPDDSGPGPTAQLAASYWSDILELASSELQTEVVAVVDYYDAYLELAQPFGFDAAKIIVEGDKERFQQLVTRPAPGLEVARSAITAACEIEVPDQPSMSASSFTRLENRLLFPDEP